MTDPRPNSLTPEMRQAIAAELVARLVKSGMLTTSEASGCTESLARVLRHVGPYADGYTIAKALDEDDWECNLIMAEELDAFSSLVSQQIRAAEFEWAKKARPVPPLPIGARVMVPGRAGAETGTITDVYAHGPAKYEIAIEGDAEAAPPTCRRRIVNFEDVRAIEAPAEAS